MQLSAPVTYACSCRPPGTPEDEFERAAAIFSGYVISSAVGRGTNAFDLDSWVNVRVQFAVSDMEKGPSSEFVDVWTADQRTACGYQFRVGATYHVYASQLPDGRLSTSSCHHVTLLKEFDVATLPVASWPVRFSTAAIILVATGGLVGLVMVGAGLVRASRPR